METGSLGGGATREDHATFPSRGCIGKRENHIGGLLHWKRQLSIYLNLVSSAIVPHYIELGAAPGSILPWKANYTLLLRAKLQYYGPHAEV